MDYNDILAAAKDQVGPYCKACPVCNGKACGNSMPGPGSKFPSNGAARNYEKWQEICVNMDTLCPNAGSKSVDEMKEIISYAKMPFIVKGTMTMCGAATLKDISRDKVRV